MEGAIGIRQQAYRDLYRPLRREAVVNTYVPPPEV